ncbi:MAG TPA: DUF362 domain-containing protein, partial [Candidatus Udaeobacter sp.]|nr:DUF362 domain-containing protein [Candidatus Udaeobacter sp.]
MSDLARPVVARRQVAVHRGGTSYAHTPPFDPDTAYPEAPFPGRVGREPNPAYAGVRSAFLLLDLDPAHQGAPTWNPLGELIAPGATVLLKPNMIRESHLTRPDEWEQIITHGSIVRAVLDYVAIALQGRGKVVIADAPQTDSDFEQIAARMGLKTIQELYAAQGSGIQVEVHDLRSSRWRTKDGVIVEREVRAGDPRGAAEVDLGAHSSFYGLGPRVYYGADYDIQETNRNHQGERHAYMFSGSALAADCVINLPKLKTHKKCGVTLSLKNLVGLNGNKNWLPHYALGAPETGGDQYPAASGKRGVEMRVLNRLKAHLPQSSRPVLEAARVVKRLGARIFGDTEEVVRSGNWHGNDTTWRMALDLARVLLYAEPSGALRPAARPGYLTVIDGIVGGEGNGPMAADRRPAGLVLAGGNPAA